MGILSAAVRSVSAALILCVQIMFMSAVTEKRCPAIRFAAAVLFAFVVGFAFELLGNVSALFPMFFNIPGLCLLTLAALKIFGLKEIMITMIIQFMCSVLNAAVISLLPAGITANGPYAGYVSMIVVPAFLTALLAVFKRRREYQNKVIKAAVSSIPLHIYIFVLIALIIEDGLVESLYFETPRVDTQMKIIRFLTLLLVICVTVLMITLTVNVLYQKHYVRINRILEEQVDSQLLHYKKREKIDSEIQSFRHDFNNHIKCLEAMMSVNKFEEATEYLEKITGMMPFGEFLFRTGNCISDAILTEAQENCAADGITIGFKGMIPQTVDSADLCIILSNAVKNAIEASRVLPKDKTISVYGNFQQDIFVLIIKNPTALTGKAKDIFPATSKPDKLSHGFGFMNMQLVVNKYGGTMHTLVEDGFFTLSITLNTHTNSRSKCE